MNPIQFGQIYIGSEETSKRLHRHHTDTSAFDRNTGVITESGTLLKELTGDESIPDEFSWRPGDQPPVVKQVLPDKRIMIVTNKNEKDIDALFEMKDKDLAAGKSVVYREIAEKFLMKRLDEGADITYIGPDYGFLA